MKIDSHHHFWKYNKDEYSWINDKMCILKNDYLPEHLQSRLMESGFDGTVAVQARQSVAETEWLLRLADENDFIKGVVGWVDLCSSQAEVMLQEYAGHPELVGVRHVIHDEADDLFILRKDFENGIRLLQQYNLTYDILIFARHLPQTIEFVKKFPDQVFVVDHIAKPEIKAKKISPWKENISKLADFHNVYCKLSGIVTEADWNSWSQEDIRPYLDIVAEAFGAERLMFGSDWPVCLLAGEYSEILNLVMNYFSGFTENEKANIFGGTAVKVYHIE